MKPNVHDDTGGIVSRLDDITMNELERERARAIARRAEALVAFMFDASRGSTALASRMIRFVAGKRLRHGSAVR